jgi:hypothetical protein
MNSTPKVFPLELKLNLVHRMTTKTQIAGGGGPLAAGMTVTTTTAYRFTSAPITLIMPENTEWNSKREVIDVLCPYCRMNVKVIASTNTYAFIPKSVLVDEKNRGTVKDLRLSLTFRHLMPYVHAVFYYLLFFFTSVLLLHRNPDRDPGPLYLGCALCALVVSLAVRSAFLSYSFRKHNVIVQLSTGERPWGIDKRIACLYGLIVGRSVESLSIVGAVHYLSLGDDSPGIWSVSTTQRDQFSKLVESMEPKGGVACYWDRSSLRSLLSQKG